jgi:glycerol-3-phosphate acyltransferase PlsY
MVWNYVIAVAITAVISYLLGCCNTSIVISKYFLRDDVRNHGSGNAGLTNFYRVFGQKKILFVILADVMKTVVSVLLGAAVLDTFCGQPVIGKLLGGLFCIVGHMYPVMFGLKGGKGVLAGGTLALFMGWKVALIVWGLFILCLLLTRFVSLGSLSAATAFPFAVGGFYQNWIYTVLAAIAGGLIVWKHRENIRRLVHGQESKLQFHR